MWTHSASSQRGSSQATKPSDRSDCIRVCAMLDQSTGSVKHYSLEIFVVFNSECCVVWPQTVVGDTEEAARACYRAPIHFRVDLLPSPRQFTKFTLAIGNHPFADNGLRFCHFMSMSTASSILPTGASVATIGTMAPSASNSHVPLAGRGLTAEAEDHSMTATLLEPLNALQALSQTLFASLAPAQTKPPPPPPASALVAADNALAAAVTKARAHQARQRRIEALKDEILELDERIGDVCADLEAGRRELEAMIVEGDVRVVAIEQAKKGTPFCLKFSLDLTEHSFVD